MATATKAKAAGTAATTGLPMAKMTNRKNKPKGRSTKVNNVVDV